jgi:hypothetical protein
MKSVAMTIAVGLVVIMLLAVPNGTIAQANHHTPTDDTWVDLNDQTANKDGSQLLADYSTQPSFFVTRRIYLRYDLSSITNDVGDGTNLRLYVTSAPFFTTGNVAIYSTGDDWNGAAVGNGGETTLVWNNAPALIARLDSTTMNTGSAGTWISFNSAALHSYINSQRLANGGDDIISFALQWDSCTTCGLFDIAFFEDQENTGGTGNLPELITFTPTAVNLASFAATEAGDHNAIAWETVSELRNLGFNLWRGTSASAPDVKLNSYVIPSQAPGGTNGFVYSYDDFNITVDTTYYYWLEDVDLNGTVTRHGPVSTAVNDTPTAITLSAFAAQTDRGAWLPIGLALISLAAAIVVWRRRH